MNGVADEATAYEAEGDSKGKDCHAEWFCVGIKGYATPLELYKSLGWGTG